MYRCIANDRIKGGACGGKINVMEKKLFGVMLDIIRKQAEVVIGNSMKIKRSGDKFAEQRASAERELAELAKTVESSRKYLMSLYESLVTGVLTNAEYLEMKRDYERKISDAVVRTQNLQARQAELAEQSNRYIGFADHLAALDADSELTAKLIDLLIERVTVNGRDDISIRFTFENSFERLWEAVADG